MKIYYDLHIHSILSPCGDENMTPYNIANMAAIKGLNLIAVADHNSSKNAQAVIDAAKELPITVIPAMEVQTSEDVHILCYFKTCKDAEKFEKEIEANHSVKNRPDIFGRQLIMDSEDGVLGEEERLLVYSCGLSVNGVLSLCEKCGGKCMPAHIDKNSFSIISNLGFIPPECNFKAVELSKNATDDIRKQFSEYSHFTSSDAHYLGDIAEPENFFISPSENPGDIIDKFFSFL